MIQAQSVTELGRVPDVETTLDIDAVGGRSFSVFRYGGVVVLEHGQYIRLGDGIQFTANNAAGEA